MVGSRRGAGRAVGRSAGATQKRQTAAPRELHLNGVSDRPADGEQPDQLGWYDTVEQALAEQNVKLADLLEQETDPALGNGGLGRLAACFLDSMATVEQPATGWAELPVRLFRQSFRGGQQQEAPDNWQRESYPWFASQRRAGGRGIGGKLESDGRELWRPASPARRSRDLPVLGYRNGVAAAAAPVAGDPSASVQPERFQRRQIPAGRRSRA